MTRQIVIRGARQHNLKNIDIDLPRNRLVVITGLSGSGKSSLAFDTLYAEGQRRYVESLSTYARQFLERLEKPDVDLIEGLSPAIAIEQRTGGHNPRSTVGTVTEIHDFLRLLYARLGVPHCPTCGQPIVALTATEILDRVMALPTGTRILVLAPVSPSDGTDPLAIVKKHRKDGFARMRINGRMVDLDPLPPLPEEPIATLEIVVDRLIVKDTIRKRLADSLELALSLGRGAVLIQDMEGPLYTYNETAVCAGCQTAYPDLTPASFSFNSPQGACAECNGLGTVSTFDEARIVPNPTLSLREGAVEMWANRNTVHFMDFLEALTTHYGVDIYTPFEELPEHFRRVLMHGSGEEEIAFFFERGSRRHYDKRPFEGIVPQLQRRYLDTDSAKSREEIRRYMTFTPCPVCRGTRLNAVSGAVTVYGKTIHAVSAMTVSEARTYFDKLSLEGQDAVIAGKIVREISARLRFLENVGLDYLSLDRRAGSLSGGESQRIRLATQIGSQLTGVMYVLDEPSIGLHQRDNQRLLRTLEGMRDLGNTVIVVEHDSEAICAADHVVELGPGAGTRGGQVVFSGTPRELLNAADSLTGQYLCGRQSIAIPAERRRGSGRQLTLTGAATNNLVDVDAAFPLGCLICITGVSGSGKSSLVLETLYPALQQHLHQAHVRAGTIAGIEGLEHIDKVIHIDQAPIGKTPRSNPGTYTGVFSHIRERFARTPEARARGYRPGRFSFNMKGGRCESCQGEGIVKIEMHFLPDVYVTCDACGGQRYNRETLDIRYKGKTIADVLGMTVNQAMAFFRSVTPVKPKLQTLVDVGLGYVQLGQPATTLSGGEAQRVKLARELGKRNTGNTVFILDEPTTGLHVDDIRKLLDVLNRLVDAGNTVIVIEHHLDVIKTADHIIDLGPEGGERGGRIVVCGTPEAVAACPESHTGEYLKSSLAN